MGFRMADKNGKGGYARVWKVEDKGNYSVVQLSTSKKSKEGTYETDFQDGFVRFVGAAHNKIKNKDVPEKGVFIQITLNDTTSTYNRETKVKYTNFVVFDFEFYNSSSGGSNDKTAEKTTAKTAKKTKDIEIEEDLPF